MINRSAPIHRSKHPRYEINNPEECDEDADQLDNKLKIIDEIIKETKEKYQEICEHTNEDDSVLCNYEYEEMKEEVAVSKPKESKNTEDWFELVAALVVVLTIYFLLS